MSSTKVSLSLSIVSTEAFEQSFLFSRQLVNGIDLRTSPVLISAIVTLDLGSDGVRSTGFSLGVSGKAGWERSGSRNV